MAPRVAQLLWLMLVALSATPMPGQAPPLSSPVFFVYEDTATRLGDEFVVDAQDTQTYASLGAHRGIDPHRVKNLLGLQVQDEDAGANTLLVVLSCSRGTLSVQRSAPLYNAYTDVIIDGRTGVSINETASSLGATTAGSGSGPSGSGNVFAAQDANSGTIRLIGNVFEINSILETAQYQPPPNGYGYVTLSINVNLLGDDDDVDDNTAGSNNSNNRTILASTNTSLVIKVIPKNDAPVIDLSGVPRGTLYSDDADWPVSVVQALEDTPLAIGLNFTVSDPDMDNRFVDGESVAGGIGAVPITSLSQYRVLGSYSTSQEIIYVSVQCLHGRLAVSGDIGATVAFLANYSTHAPPLLSNFSRHPGTAMPTASPTASPLASAAPTGLKQFVNLPTGQPTGQPTCQPTKKSAKPTALPTPTPTGATNFPTGQPSGQPSFQPSTQPTSRPSSVARNPFATSFSPTYSPAPGAPSANAYVATNTDPNVFAGTNPLEQAQEEALADLAAAHFRNLSNTDTIAFLGTVPKRNAKLDYDVRLGGARGLFLRGQYDEVRAVLKSLVYTPDKDWFGVDTLTIYVNDLGNIGVDGEKDLLRTVLIDVAPVQDPPIINLPSRDMLVAIEDMTAIIGADCCHWAVYDDGLPSSHAISSPLVVPSEHNLDPSTATNASELSFSISDRDMYQDKNEARFVLRRTDKSQGSRNVLNNDIRFNTTYKSASSTDVLSYTYDWNSHVPINANVTLYLACSHGTMTMLRVSEALTFVLGAGFHDDSIVVRGSLIDVNNALRGLLYTPDLNWNSQQAWAFDNPLRASEGLGDSLLVKTLDFINITVVDSAGLRAEESVSVYVKPSNDPPVLTMGANTPHDSIRDEGDQLSRVRLAPTTLTCAENTACPLDELMCRDIDALESPGGAILFTISAANGTFSIDPLQAGTLGAAFFQTGIGNSGGTSRVDGYVGLARGLAASEVTLTIPAVAVDTLLRGIIYHPAPDYFGPDLISISVDDLGNTGYGLQCSPGLEALNIPCRLTDHMQIAVNITSKPDRIEIVLPPGMGGVQTGVEDSDLVITGLRFVNHDQLSRPWLRPSAQLSQDESRYQIYQDANVNHLQKMYPSAAPTEAPSVQPTFLATFTLSPSVFPSQNPTQAPTNFNALRSPQSPSFLPTGQPTRRPSGQPTRQPTGQPTAQPSRSPTGQPTGNPTYYKQGPPTSGFRGQNTYSPTARPTAAAYMLSPRNITYGNEPGLLADANLGGTDGLLPEQGGKLFRLELSCSGGTLRLVNVPAGLKSGLSQISKVQTVTITASNNLTGFYTLALSTANPPYTTQTTVPVNIGPGTQIAVQTALQALPLAGQGVSVSMAVCNASVCSFDVTFPQLTQEISLISVDDSRLYGNVLQVSVTQPRPGRLAVPAASTASRLVYTGTIRDLNIAAANLIFSPAPNANILNSGLMAIHVSITDDETLVNSVDGYDPTTPLGGNGVGAAAKTAITTADFYVRVAAKNDAPVVRSAGEVYLDDPSGSRVKRQQVVAVASIVLEEEEEHSLGSFFIIDDDSADYPMSSMSLTVAAAHGVFRSDNATVMAMMSLLGQNADFDYMTKAVQAAVTEASIASGGAAPNASTASVTTPSMTNGKIDDPYAAAAAAGSIQTWGGFRGPFGNGYTLAPSIASPRLSFKFGLSNGTSSGAQISQQQLLKATFVASTLLGAVAPTITILSVQSGSVSNGMAFTAMGASGYNETTTLIACSIVSGAGSCVLSNPISLPATGRVVTAAMTRPLNVGAVYINGTVIAGVSRLSNLAAVVTNAALDTFGTVYLSGQNNATLYALSAATGSIKWTYSRRSPTSPYRTLYSGAAVGYSSQTAGYNTTCALYPSLCNTPNDATAYIVSSDGVVLAVSGLGSRRWKYSLGSVATVKETPTPRVRGDILFVTHAGSKTIVALSASKGKLLWSYTTSGYIKTTPAVHEGLDGSLGPLNVKYQRMVYVGDDAKTVYALNFTLATSQTAPTKSWSYVAGDAIASSMAISADGKSIFFGCKDGYLYGLSTASGSLKWRFQAGAAFSASAPAIGPDGSVMASSVDSYFYVVNGTSGALQWQYQTGSWAGSSPAVARDGTVYVGSDDGYLYALNHDGALRWRVQTQGAVQASPAVAPDGTVYVSSRDGYLYSIVNALNSPCEYTADCNPGSPADTSDGGAYVCSPDSRICVCSNNYIVDSSLRQCILAPPVGSRAAPDSLATPLLSPSSAAARPTDAQLLLDSLYGPVIADPAARIIRLHGTLDDINQALVGLSYVPDMNYNGPDAIVVRVCDECFAESYFFPGASTGPVQMDCSLCHSLSVPVSIAGVNDPPRWHIPASAVTCQENAAVSFSGGAGIVQLYDADAGQGDVYVRIRVTRGTLSINSVPSTVTLLMGTGEFDQELRLQGPLSAINMALAGLVYRPPVNWNSVKSGLPDYISLYADDLGSTGDTGATISATNWINTTATSVGNDGSKGASASYSGARDAGLTNLKQGLSAKSTVAVVVLEGMNHAPYLGLPGGVYRYYPCDTQDSQRTETYMRNDIPVENQCHSVVSVDTFYVQEDSPTIISASSQVNVSSADARATAAASHLMAGEVRGNNSWVQVYDADANFNVLLSSEYLLTLSSMHGVLTLPNCRELGLRIVTGMVGSTVGSGTSGDKKNSVPGPFGQASRAPDYLTQPKLSPQDLQQNAFATAAVSALGGSLSIIGSLGNVNAALQRLQYAPASNFYGTDAISVYVNDRPYSPADGLATNETIPVFVSQVVDAPTVLLPPELAKITVLEDTRMALRGIQVVDPEFLEFQTGVPTFSSAISSAASAAANPAALTQTSVVKFVPNIVFAVNVTANVTAHFVHPSTGYLIFSDSNGTTTAVDVLGNRVWRRWFGPGRVKLTVPVQSTNAAFSNIIYLGSSNAATIYAVDVATGSNIWSAMPDTSIPISSATVPPLVSDGYIFVISSKKYLYSISEKGTHARRWRIALPDTVSRPPVLLAPATNYSTLFLLTDNTFQLCSIDTSAALSRPVYRWTVSAAAQNTVKAGFLSNPYDLISTGAVPIVLTRDWSTIYVGITYSVRYNASSAVSSVTKEFRGLISAYSARSGNMTWQVDVMAGVTSTLLVDASNTLYAFSGDKTLYAINKDSSIKWSRPVPLSPFAPCALDESKALIYFAGRTDDRYLYALSSVDGSEVWRFPTQGFVVGSLTLSPSDHRLFYSTNAHTVFALVSQPVAISTVAAALGIKDPRQRWRYLIHPINTTQPSLKEKLAALSFAANYTITTSALTTEDNSLVIYGDQMNGTIVALRTADASLAWTMRPNGKPGQVHLTAPALVRSTLFVGCTDGNLYSLSLQGSVLWKYSAGGTIMTTAAPLTQFVKEGQDRVFVAARAKLTALSLGGKKLWSFNAAGWFTIGPILLTAPVSYNETDATSPLRRAIGFPVVVVSDQREITALNAATGAVVWSFETAFVTTGITVSPAQDMLYFSLLNGTVGALGWRTNASMVWDQREWIQPTSIIWTSQILWSTVLGTAQNHSESILHAAPAVSGGGAVYIGGSESYLYALDGSTGGTLWTFQAGGPISGQATVTVDGFVYFGSDDGYLYALNHDGALRWRVQTQGAVQASPAVAPDGTVYVSSRDGYLYSIVNALNSLCEYTADCNFAYSKPAYSDPLPPYVCAGSACVCADGFMPDPSQRECLRLGSHPDAASPYRVSPPYSDYIPPMPTYKDPAASSNIGGRATDFQSQHFSYNTLHNSWNVTMVRVMQSSLLRVHLHSEYGRVMLASSSGLRFYRVPNATQETQRLSAMAPGQMTMLQRMMFSGATGSGQGGMTDDGTPESDDVATANAYDEAFWASGDVSSNPVQVWWKSVLIEGRLGDVNRALATITYAPDLNWNSQLPLQKLDDAGNTVLSSQTQIDVITVRVSNPYHDLPISSVAIHATIEPANDAPVVRVSNSILDPLILTDDQLAPLTVDSLTVYTTENTPVDIMGTSCFDVDLQFLSPATPQGSVPGDVLQQPLAQGFLRVVVETLHGVVSLSDQSPVVAASLSNITASVGINIETSTSGTGQNTSYISFTGPIDALNLALATLTFTPTLFYFGIHAQIKITVSDLANGGWGGEKSDTQVIRIVVTPINNPPIISTPSDFSAATIQIIDGGSFLRLQGSKYMPWLTSLGGSVGSQISGSSSGSAVAAAAAARGDKYTPLTPWQSGYELWCLLEVKSTSSISTEPTVLSFGHQKAGAATFQWDNRQVADIHLGSFSSHPRYMTIYKNLLYFQADNGVTGPEMWRAEGQFASYENSTANTQAANEPWANPQPATTADEQSNAMPDDLSQGMASLGISQFLDQIPGSDGAAPSDMHVHGNYLYFASGGVDLSWMVKDRHRDTCHSFRQSTYDARVFYAVSETNVWVPGRLYDCPLGYHWASTEEAHNYFLSSPVRSDDPEYYHNPMTTDNRMWHSDAGVEIGQRHGPERYNQRNIDPSKTLYEQSTSLEHFHETKVYYDECGWNGYRYGNLTRTYFRFRDSHKTLQYKHAGKPDSYRPDQDPLNKLGNANFAGIVCIVGAEENVPAAEAFRSTDNPFPYLPRDTQGLGNPEYNLAFAPPLLRRNLGGGRELWRTDGTVHGTSRLEDLEPGPSGSDPSDLQSFHEFLYFAAYTQEHGRELWRTRGVRFGNSSEFGSAELVSIDGAGQDEMGGINPGPGGSDPKYMTTSGNYLFLAATNVYSGRELWAVKYTQGATSLPDTTYARYTLGVVLDIVPGQDSSAPMEITSVLTPSPGGGYWPLVFFSAYSPETGRELWRSDGTGAGTALVTDINFGPLDSNPRYLVWFRKMLLFQADDGIHGIELWSHDPITGVTTMVSDIRSGKSSSNPSFFTPFTSQRDSRSYVVFTATDGYGVTGSNSTEGVGGSQMWRTDGTLEGTYRLFQKTTNDLYVDRDSLDAAFPAQMMVYNHGLYLPANYGLETVAIPHGGISTGVDINGNNADRLQGIDQAIVVSDVDTGPEGKVTVTLGLDKGLLIVNSPDYVNIASGSANISDSSSSSSSSSSSGSSGSGAGSAVRYKFLVAEARETDSGFISRGLQAQGHLVDTVTTAEAAFAAIVSKFVGSHYGSADEALKYDAVFMSIDFVPIGTTHEESLSRSSSTGDFAFARGSGLQDGIQMIRIIRRWESEMADLAAPDMTIVDAANKAAVNVALAQGLAYSSTLQDVVAQLGLGQLVASKKVLQATHNGTSFSWAGYEALKIVCMSKLDRMEFGEQEAYAAGADLFLYEPAVDYVALAKQSDLVGPLEGMTHTSLGMVMLQEEKLRYDRFISLALNIMPKPSDLLRVTATIRAGESPPASTLMTLPGLASGRSYFGSTIVLEGTLQDVNSMFRNVFYYAPFGISGAVSLTVTVTDRPKVCTSVLSGDVTGIHFAHGNSLGGMQHLSGPSNFYQVPTLSLMPSASIYGGSLSDADASADPAVLSDGTVVRPPPTGSARNVSYCDEMASKTVSRSLPLLVVAVNAPPVITLIADDFTALRGYNIFTALPSMTISDSGHEQEIILDSFGYTTSAPVTLTVTASLGRLSWKNKDNVVFLQGTGMYDKTVVVRGGLMHVNKIIGGFLGVGGADDGTGTRVSLLVYSCLVADGCTYGGTDTITITVNDEGFYGKGGPLKDTATVKVSLV